MATDTNYGGVRLLLHGDGANDATSFTDNSKVPKVVTAYGNAKISTAQSKFGGSSCKFDGLSTSYLESLSAEFDIAGADFTVECWVFPLDNSGSGSTRTLFHFNAGGTAGLHIHRNTSQYLIVDNGATGTTAGNIVLPLNQWSHIAVTRSGSTIRGFVNGVQCLTHAAQTYVSATKISIGRYGSGSITGNANAYLDDIRITKGVARYVSNFTPPLEAFPDTGVQIVGTVRDDTGSFCARTVRAYLRSDGAFSGSAISDPGTGAFAIATMFEGAHTVLALDDAAGTAYNALVFDNVIPA